MVQVDLGKLSKFFWVLASDVFDYIFQELLHELQVVDEDL